MENPVENAKRLAAFKAVDNHVVVMNQNVYDYVEASPYGVYLL